MKADIAVFWSADCGAAATGIETVSKADQVAASLWSDPIEGVENTAARPAERCELLQCHEPGYVDAVVEGRPLVLAETAGLSWDPGLARSVLASTGGCRDAATVACTTGVAGTLSSGLHHARRERGKGCCTFNGVALAALTFRDLGAERVLVADLDAHSRRAA